MKRRLEGYGLPVARSPSVTLILCIEHLYSVPFNGVPSLGTLIQPVENDCLKQSRRLPLSARHWAPGLRPQGP
jgi:hypothetical protein